MISYVGGQDGCTTIRVVIPHILLNQYNHKNIIFQAYYSNVFNVDIKFYNDASVIQFQRSATDKQADICELVKRKIKVLTRSFFSYEIDDDLFNIPQWNYAYEFYLPLKKHITKIISLADGVTVSTPKLKELYSQFNSNIVVIPNYLPRFIWGIPTCAAKDVKIPTIIYPCSSNHFSIKKDVPGGDLGNILKDFIRKTTSIYNWVFIGGCTLEFDDLIKTGKIQRYGWVAIWNYPEFLRTLNADIGIAPLELNDFNRCKSNIKSLEYTALGIPGVYTDIDPYGEMELKAKSEEEFISHIEKLSSSPDYRQNIWRKTYDSLKNDLYWEDNGYLNLRKYAQTYLDLMGKKDLRLV